jgi:hypothetical protein
VGAAWHEQKNGVPSQPNVQTAFLRAAVPPLLSCPSQVCSSSFFPLSGFLDILILGPLRITGSMEQCDYMIAQTNARSSVPLGSKARTRLVLRIWTEVAQRPMAHGNR